MPQPGGNDLLDTGEATATMTLSTAMGTAVVTATAGIASGQTTVTLKASSSLTTILKVFLLVVMREFGN